MMFDKRRELSFKDSWINRNLFNTWYNVVLTFLIIIGLSFLITNLISWLLAADFAIVRKNLTLFLVGGFPRDQLWRLWVAGHSMLCCFGIASGVLWRSAQAEAQAKGFAAEQHSWLDLLRRFWVLVALLIFFLSFTRGVLPYLLLVSALGVFVVSRELARRVEPTVTHRGLFLAGLVGLSSFVVLAGTSGLGALSVGGLIGTWTLFEVRHTLESTHQNATAVSRFAGLGAGVVVWQTMIAIGFDGYGWDTWTGFHLNLFVTVIGISSGFPIGLCLALGRSSKMPIIKTICVVFIEFCRGVPLITLLFFAAWMMPLLFPRSVVVPDLVTRCMIVLIAFSAAYIAEIVRGGLQSVPVGQVEAAQAAGLSQIKIQRLIVLPQALRAVIPAMVGQFISLFKDTTLLSILKILEMLHGSRVSNSQTEFLGLGLSGVTLTFVAVAFWVVAYTMSKESRRLETRLGVGINQNLGQRL